MRAIKCAKYKYCYWRFDGPRQSGNTNAVECHCGWDKLEQISQKEIINLFIKLKASLYGKLFFVDKKFNYVGEKLC